MTIHRELFYSQGKNSFVPNYVEKDSSTWPVEWKTTFYKKYPRFDQVPLPEVTEENELFTLIAGRKSNRNFTGEPLSLNEISQILKYSCGEFDIESEIGTHKHRAQPSGGARYPVEMYVLIFHDSGSLARGVYHYNVQKHALEHTPHDKHLLQDPRNIVISEWSSKASALLVMTGIFWRSEMKYRGRGSWYTYLEAGHIAQNVHLVANKLKLKSVGLGGVWDDSLEELLIIDPKIEAPLHTIALGK